MTNSLKIGAIAGLIAGLIAGIMGIISVLILFNIGFQYLWILPDSGTPFIKIITREIVSNLLWGVILGAIYSKVYRAIPSKALINGLLFGLFIYLITDIRWVVYMLIYSIPEWIPAYFIHGFFRLVSYGLVLGILYEFLGSKYYVPRKEPKIIQYDMMGGI